MPNAVFLKENTDKMYKSSNYYIWAASIIRGLRVEKQVCSCFLFAHALLKEDNSLVTKNVQIAKMMLIQKLSPGKQAKPLAQGGGA